MHSGQECTEGHSTREELTGNTKRSTAQAVKNDHYLYFRSSFHADKAGKERKIGRTCMIIEQSPMRSSESRRLPQCSTTGRENFTATADVV